MEAVQKLIDVYVDKFDGNLYLLEDGVLAFAGLAVLMAPKKKTAVIKEVYLNDWSSTISITLYNKTPKKYLNLIDKKY
jgi:hypothetical protein